VSFRKLAAFVFLFGLVGAATLRGAAGTTGGIHGLVTDVESGAPIAGAAVSVESPSQVAKTTTDGSGHYDFISLNPDTYMVTFSKAGYDVSQIPGITVIADQSRRVDVRLQKSVKTIGHVAVHAAPGLVRAGVVADVFSVNASGQRAAAPLGGSGALNQAYGAIASAPGVNYDQGQQGWYQSIYIRGGDIDQVAYEFDGVPVVRESDQGAVTTLTSLGQQEVQVYAGGTPASTDATGLAGYVNQVVKTGTYPGYADFTAGIGGPAHYDKGTFEVAGSTPDRNFSYYVGTQLISQGFRYGDQFNGASNPLFFYPLAIGNPVGSPPTPLNGTVWDGSAPWLYAPGTTNAMANVTDQETITNFHFGLPHKHDSNKDDIQLLYVNSLILQKFYGSAYDQGLIPTELAFDGDAQPPLPLTYFDGYAYNGKVFAPPNPALVSTALFPNSPQNRAAFDQLPILEREGSQNGVALGKFQYQHNINDHSYLRFFGYTDYAIWFISGPVSADLVYGGQLPDYEVTEHKYGGDLVYSNQLNDKHLLTVTGNYFTSHLETYSGQSANFFYYTDPTTSLVGRDGNCYSYASGVRVSCFDPTWQGDITAGLTPGTPPAGTPATLAGAQWLVTEPGPRAQIDRVTPYFSGYSVADQYRPTEKLTMDLGVRLDSFSYRFDDLVDGFPARQFWFKAYNNEFCFGKGYLNPVQRTFDPITGAVSACPAGTSPVHLVNSAGGTHNEQIYQPRLGATYQVNSDIVLRATYGRYVRPAATSYQEFTTVQQDSPSFISQFYNLGFNSPIHNLHSDTANNYDFSIEQHFHNTDVSYKLTPFYRSTQGQVEFLSLNAQGVVAGINAGQQRSYGIEFAINKGDFAQDGFSLKASANFLHSRITYGDAPNGNNVIDLLNTYIQQYNSFTSACAAAAPQFNYTSMCGIYGNSNAQPSFMNSSSGVVTANPYYNQKPQPLFDRNGSYTTYSMIPAPWNNANGFETPFSSTLILNYKHRAWSLTPTFTYTDGYSYGSPLVWPGYDPSSCGNTAATGVNTGPQSCTGFIMIPDKYTGVFDGIGAFREPARLTMNFSISASVSDRVDTTLTVANLIDHCYQRGFPWDSPTTCIYGQLASNLLAPAGNFVAHPPVQLAYPYGNWYNNVEVAQEGQRSPTEWTLETTFKL
jgi:hypothetical protein